MERTTKASQVLNHLKEHGSITSWEAIENYGATRLSAIIFNLRRHNHSIESMPMESIDRYGNEVRFVKYIYHGQIED